MKETILNVLKKYKIESDQIYTITSDNGAYMLSAINLIKKNILESHPLESDSESDNGSRNSSCSAFQSSLSDSDR